MHPKRGPRVRASAPAVGDGREAQYDLLTAALIGAALGATATLLLRQGPGGRRPIDPILEGAGRAGKGAVRASASGARWAHDRGGELLERVPVDRIERDVRESVGAARERIDGFVQHELRDLRRALRAQRKRFGV